MCIYMYYKFLNKGNFLSLYNTTGMYISWINTVLFPGKTISSTVSNTHLPLVLCVIASNLQDNI